MAGLLLETPVHKRLLQKHGGGWAALGMVFREKYEQGSRRSRSSTARPSETATRRSRKAQSLKAR